MRFKTEDGKYAKCTRCSSKQFELVQQGEIFKGVYCKECGAFIGWVNAKQAGVFKSHGDYKEYE